MAYHPQMIIHPSLNIGVAYHHTTPYFHTFVWIDNNGTLLENLFSRPWNLPDGTIKQRTKRRFNNTQ